MRTINRYYNTPPTDRHIHKPRHSAVSRCSRHWTADTSTIVNRCYLLIPSLAMLYARHLLTAPPKITTLSWHALLHAAFTLALLDLHKVILIWDDLPQSATLPVLTLLIGSKDDYRDFVLFRGVFCISGRKKPVLFVECYRNRTDSVNTTLYYLQPIT